MRDERCGESGVYNRGEPRAGVRDRADFGEARDYGGDRVAGFGAGAGGGEEIAGEEGVRAVEAVRFDVNKSADHQEIYDYLERKHGKLDILINNAGVLDEGLPRPNGGAGFNSTSRVSAEKLRQTFETNFFQPIFLTQTLLPLIRKSPAGRIVNLSSLLGSLTEHRILRRGFTTGRRLLTTRRRRRSMRLRCTWRKS